MSVLASAAGSKAPGLLARSAGLFYLGTIAFGIVGELRRKRLIVPGDATATAQNILGSEALYRGATATDVLALACYVGLTVLLYELLKPVNKTVSALAAASGLVSVAIDGSATVTQIATLLLEKGAPYLDVFSKPQLEALASVFARLHGQAYDVGFIFLGFYCILIGYLVAKSGSMPVAIGVLTAITGVCYLLTNFSPLVAPSFASFISTFMLYPVVVGKASMILWLLIAGVNVTNWNDRNQARRSAT